MTRKALPLPVRTEKTFECKSLVGCSKGYESADPSLGSPSCTDYDPNLMLGLFVHAWRLGMCLTKPSGLSFPDRRVILSLSANHRSPPMRFDVALEKWEAEK